MLVHIFQIVPLLLVLSIGSTDSLISIPEHFPEFSFLATVSALTFFASFKIRRKRGQTLFLILISILYLYLVNKLYLSPALGVIMTAIYILLLFKSKTSNISDRMPVSYSIALPYFVSLILFMILKFGQYNDLRLLLVAVNLSFASLIYLIGIRVNFHSLFRIVAAVAVLVSSLILLFNGQIGVALQITTIWMITLTLLSLIVVYRYKDVEVESLLERLFQFPEAVIISYFVLLASAGTVVLGIPISRASEVPLSLLDGFFTAMSAVCVTGLIVLDTPVDFSIFGQAVILVLIQLGGFGIVAISSWVLMGLQSKRLSLRHEQTISEMTGHPSTVGVQLTLKRILLYFLAFEAGGTLLLFWRFLASEESAAMAFWRALFTAISAFCNAGFALQSESLIPYQTDEIILLTVSVLIIAGGFAPLMAFELPKKLWNKKLNLQEKLILSSTIGLLVVGFVFYLLVEWNHSLSGLNLLDKIANSWFQSATTRTAGFNSVDFTSMTGITPFFIMLLMFVGGNPGGTAGGVKTITFITILLACVAGIRGENHVRVFNRQIPAKGIFRTIAVFAIALGTLFIAFFMLASTQNIDLLPLLFETVSALATVGLSMGVTGALDEVGKVIIILCMLIGRVGPLAFILLLFRTKKTSRWGVPSENIYIS